MSTSNLAVAQGETGLRPDATRTSMGICLDGEHPTLRGRAHVRWTAADGREREAWLPMLQGLAPARGDRVLLTLPENHDEPVVLGILDGLGPRAEPPPADEGPLVQLEGDEALRVAAADGTPMLEVRVTPEGPEVRLLVAPAGLRMPGTLRVSAEGIELEARKGEFRIDAAGDVKVTGEIVRLN